MEELNILTSLAPGMPPTTLMVLYLLYKKFGSDSPKKRQADDIVVQFIKAQEKRDDRYEKMFDELYSIARQQAEINGRLEAKA